MPCLAPPPAPAAERETPAEVAEPSPPPHVLACMEIWGGTEAVQRTLQIPGIDAWVYSQPHENADQGGDIHYVSSCFTGRVARFFVADVAGHGQGVADLAGRLRALMRKHIHTLDQTDFARVLNHEFSQEAPDGRFATAILASYFAPTDHLVICNAGHPRPLWFRARTQAWTLLNHELQTQPAQLNNLPLGVVVPTQYHQFAVQLEPEDMVVLYTDSLIEAKHPEHGMLGEAGLLALAQRVSEQPHARPEGFGNALLSAVADHRQGRPSDDDQTLLVLHHNATAGPTRPMRQTVRFLAGLIGLAGD